VGRHQGICWGGGAFATAVQVSILALSRHFAQVISPVRRLPRGIPVTGGRAGQLDTISVCAEQVSHSSNSFAAFP